MIPEYPDWPPWWLRYAEWGGKGLVLADGNELRKGRCQHKEPRELREGYIDARYGVLKLEDLRDCTVCGQRLSKTIAPETVLIWGGDSLPAAEAAFEEAERRMVGR